MRQFIAFASSAVRALVQVGPGSAQWSTLSQSACVFGNCEGAFVILPDQEAALRTSDFQARYAMGIMEGLEEYFRELGTR